MKRLFSLLSLFIIFLFTSLFLIVPKSSSDEYDNITTQIEDLKKALDMSVAATKPLESQLNSIKKEIGDIKNSVYLIEQDLKIKKKNIDAGYKNLARKETVLRSSVRDFYIQSYHSSPLLIFLSLPSYSHIIQVLTYQKEAVDQDKAIITNIALSIQDLKIKEESLKNEQGRLAKVKSGLDEQSAKLDEIVSGAKAYQTVVLGQIAQLSARQQEILTARSGTFIVSIGDSELADDYNASIKGFRESAPNGYFAVFAFGAHTHRKGMSQYGARGRANANQNYIDILRTYYGKEPVSKDTGGNINVSGQGSIDFEGRYLLGIAEMPSSWHKEALKAQAIAARTYAYRYKQEGKEICTTEACQVFLASKADNPPSEWRQAVEETRGQILEDVVTYYSSTTGGYVGSLWDTTDGNGGSNLFDKAYERLAGSPWFYKAWYTKGYSPTTDKCGRSNPWLSPEDLADIINAARYRDDRVTPITTSCWGGNPYSHDELRAKSNGPSSVNSVTVNQGNGVTNEVVFQTNIGEIRLSGSDFKTAFNIRAPGYLAIPQSGFAFYNVERK